MRKKSQCWELTLNKVILTSLTLIIWAPHLQDQTTQVIALLQLVIQHYPCELHSGVSIDPLLFVFSLYFSVHRCGHLSSLCNYLSENRCAFWRSLFKVLVLSTTLCLRAKGDFVCCLSQSRRTISSLHLVHRQRTMKLLFGIVSKRQL